MNSSKADLNKSPDKRANILLRLLGPGLVTGAADDDPSGIATYSQAGAQFGYGLLSLHYSGPQLADPHSQRESSEFVVVAIL
jgi:hypothetical protein